MQLLLRSERAREAVAWREQRESEDDEQVLVDERPQLRAGANVQANRTVFEPRGPRLRQKLTHDAGVGEPDRRHVRDDLQLRAEAEIDAAVQQDQTGIDEIGPIDELRSKARQQTEIDLQQVVQRQAVDVRL